MTVRATGSFSNRERNCRLFTGNSAGELVTDRSRIVDHNVNNVMIHRITPQKEKAGVPRPIVVFRHRKVSVPLLAGLSFGGTETGLV
jgi:hypothetical protein